MQLVSIEDLGLTYVQMAIEDSIRGSKIVTMCSTCNFSSTTARYPFSLDQWGLKSSDGFSFYIA
jgi:hypothetical protein